MVWRGVDRLVPGRLVGRVSRFGRGVVVVVVVVVARFCRSEGVSGVWRGGGCGFD